MAILTPEQRALGRQNAATALGVTRRDFLKAAAVAPALGAFYFGYSGIEKPVKAAIIGTGNEGCQAMIRDHNRAFIDYIGFCDARPTQQARAVTRVHGPQGLRQGRREGAQEVRHRRRHALRQGRRDWS